MYFNKTAGNVPIIIFLETDKHVNPGLRILQETAGHPLEVRENVVLEQSTLD